MCFYIGIEDLAANALIEALEKGQKRFVTYEALENYGSEVVRFLNEEKGEKAILILSRESTNALFRNYSEYFVEKLSESGLGIELSEDKSVDDLKEQFRGYLALDVLMAFVNSKAVKALGV